MRCKLCIKLVHRFHILFSLMLMDYSFQTLKLGLAKLYPMLEMGLVASNHVDTGCIFLNLLNKYGIFLSV
jgi:hypothetical protein